MRLRFIFDFIKLLLICDDPCRYFIIVRDKLSKGGSAFRMEYKCFPTQLGNKLNEILEEFGKGENQTEAVEIKKTEDTLARN